MACGNPCLMVQGSAEASPAHFKVRPSELRPGIGKSQEHKVILRLAAFSEEDQDNSIPLVLQSGLRVGNISWQLTEQGAGLVISCLLDVARTSLAVLKVTQSRTRVTAGRCQVPVGYSWNYSHS